jgi:hypothetical protein
MAAPLQPEQFGPDAESPLEHYGIPVVPAWRERELRKEHRWESIGETRDVPVSQIRGGQHKVDTHRVHDIAKRGVDDPKLAKIQPPYGVEIPEGGVMLSDGHHRAVADVMTGKQFIKVHVAGRYGERY